MVPGGYCKVGIAGSEGSRRDIFKVKASSSRIVLTVPSGGPDQPADGSAQGAAHPVDGAVHGVLLHAVLDALRHHSAGGHLGQAGPGQSRGQRGALHPGQAQHRG